MADAIGQFLPRPVLPPGYDQFWWEKAACREASNAIFFPEKGNDARRLMREAKAFCAVCPVRAECLIEAAHFNDDWNMFSVRGGLAAKERRQLKRAIAKAGGYGDPLHLRDTAEIA